MAMASAIPVEDSPITSVKIKTSLADSWIRYQEIAGYMLEPFFFPWTSSTDQSELGTADHIGCLNGVLSKFRQFKNVFKYWWILA